MFVYSLTVTVVTAGGLLVISVLEYPILNTGATLSDAVARMTGAVAFAAILILPMLIFYMLAVAGVAGVIRRRTWWAGALAGLIPALLLFGTLTLMDAGTTSIGTPAELAAAGTARTIATVLSIAWCTLVASACIRLARTSTASSASGSGVA